MTTYHGEQYDVILKKIADPDGKKSRMSQNDSRGAELQAEPRMTFEVVTLDAPGTAIFHV